MFSSSFLNISTIFFFLSSILTRFFVVVASARIISLLNFFSFEIKKFHVTMLLVQKLLDLFRFSHCNAALAKKTTRKRIKKKNNLKSGNVNLHIFIQKPKHFHLTEFSHSKVAECEKKILLST